MSYTPRGLEKSVVDGTAQKEVPSEDKEGSHESSRLLEYKKDEVMPRHGPLLNEELDSQDEKDSTLSSDEGNRRTLERFHQRPKYRVDSDEEITIRDRNHKRHPCSVATPAQWPLFSVY